MRYTYAYKTPDGVRHEAVIDAPSRDVAFSLLRKRGIRPIKVVAADGAKANGEIRGVRKRMVAVVAVGVAIVAGGVAFFAGEQQSAMNAQQPASNGQQRTTASPRHQIYGDPVIVEAFERGNFEMVFTNRLDQMLAWFAQPGKFMCPRGTDPRRCAGEFADAFNPSTGAWRETCPLELLDDDSREVRELKQIVSGLHEEMAAYLANGNGTPRSYWRRLIERTVQESQIYERTKRELENEKGVDVWEEKNAALRRLGLRTIPNPKEAE